MLSAPVPGVFVGADTDGGAPVRKLRDRCGHTHAPNTYFVQVADTLWAISALFLLIPGIGLIF